MKLHEAVERFLCGRSHLVIRQGDGSRSDEMAWLAGLAFDAAGAVIGCRWAPDVELARRFGMDQLPEVLELCQDHPNLVAQLVRSDGVVVTLAQADAGECGAADAVLPAAIALHV